MHDRCTRAAISAKLVSSIVKNRVAATKYDQEVQSLGEYTPYVLLLREMTNSEALGCPVDRAKRDAIVAAH